MSQWYYARNGAQAGPVTTEDLNGLLARGELGGGDLVWRDGMPEWRAAGTVPELAPHGAPMGQPAYAPTPGYAPSPAYGQPAYGTPGYGQPGQGTPLGYAQPTSYAGAPVPYAYPGGFWWRVLAYVIDSIVLWIPNTIIGFGIQAVADNFQGGGFRPGRRGMPPPTVWGILAVGWAAQIVLAWLYFALQESSAARATLGKRACGLLVTDMTGNRIGFGHATGRYFGKILSGMILGIGFIMVAFTDRKQGLHDQLAKTLVWKKP